MTTSHKKEQSQALIRCTIFIVIKYVELSPATDLAFFKALANYRAAKRSAGLRTM